MGEVGGEVWGDLSWALEMYRSSISSSASDRVEVGVLGEVVRFCESWREDVKVGVHERGWGWANVRIQVI